MHQLSVTRLCPSSRRDEKTGKLGKNTGVEKKYDYATLKANNKAARWKAH